jgi:predicted phosphodiesterase
VRYLILSDIHGNLEGLSAVLTDADTLDPYDKIVNCGDLAGYGPDPNDVIAWCRQTNAIVIRGNHDKACAQLENLEWFNPIAQASALWTFGALSPENRRYLVDLPRGPVMFDDFQVFHGAPQDEDEYIVTEADARTAATFVDIQVSFFGHTHLQGAFAVHRNGIRRLQDDSIFALDESMKYLINPGSVGQPRDGDPRAGYALYDSEERTIEFRRVDYDHETTLRKIVEVGLPDVLGRRLAVGV